MIEKRRQIGQRVAAARRARRLTQAGLAERIGVGAQQVHRYELGTEAIPLLRFAALCDALRAEPRDLLYGGDAYGTGRFGADLREAFGLAHGIATLDPAIQAALRALIEELSAN